MILISKASFPKSSIQAAAKKFTEMPKLPATVKRQGPFFNLDDQGNVNATSLYIFSNQQITQEEKKFVEHRLKIFSDVPGFSFSLTEWMNMEETLLVITKHD